MVKKYQVNGASSIVSDDDLVKCYYPVCFIMMYINALIFIISGVFISFGLSGVIPALHFVITDGFWHAVNKASLGWLALMAVLYIVGAIIYAVRIPERFFPGKFDIWVSCTRFHFYFYFLCRLLKVCSR